MQRDECIYNLIPKVIPSAQKPKPYVSKYDPKLKPTGSTFGFKGKATIEGSNLGRPQRVDAKKKAQSFGSIVSKPNPKAFMKKGSKCVSVVDRKSQPKKFNYTGGRRKPALIKATERPVMGLKSSKDYVTANAVETILAVPGHRARAKNDSIQYKGKVDYGKVPAYLNEVKDEIRRENEMIDEFVRENQYMQDEEEQKVEAMDEYEREELIDALKAKWDHVNKIYQKMGHNVVFDTQGKVRRKENLENELDQIEKDIELLQRGQVLIANN